MTNSFLFALYVSNAFNQPLRSRLYLLVFRWKRSGIRRYGNFSLLHTRLFKPLGIETFDSACILSLH